MANLNSSSWGMNSGYKPYGDALPSYGNGAGSYSYLPAGGSGGGGGGMFGDMGSAAGSGFAMGGPLGAGIAAGGSLLTSLFGMAAQKRAQQRELQARADLQNNDLAQNTAQGTQALASKESMLDPFRARMMQMGDVAKLDRVANATMTRPTIGVPGPYQKYVPQLSGGYSYQKSPTLINAAKNAQTSVLSGNPDPSMTNPDNYGKTGALDLLSIANGTKNPALTSSFSTGAPSTGSSIGADPVSNMVRQGYQAQLGRPASDAEIQGTIGQLSKIYGRQMTAADSGLIQGWIANNLATSPEAMARKSGAAGQGSPASPGAFTPSWAAGSGS